MYILSKSLDSSIAESYRPILVCVVSSRMLEYYILEECSDYQFSEYQFGFVPRRIMHMATALIQVIISKHLLLNQSSTEFFSSLLVEIAYDVLLNSVLFDCASALLNHFWRIMYNWYSDMNVCIRLFGKLRPHI